MSGSFDNYLGTVLKNWVAQSKPPVYGRARLLWLARHAPLGTVSHARRQVEPNTYQPADWSHLLAALSIVHTFQTGMTGSRILT